MVGAAPGWSVAPGGGGWEGGVFPTSPCRHCIFKHNYGVWGSERQPIQAEQHTCPPRSVSNAASKSNKEQMQPLAPTLDLHTDNELERPADPPAKGAPILLARGLPAGLTFGCGPRLFGTWTDSPGCSSQCLFMTKESLWHESPRRLACYPSICSAEFLSFISSVNNRAEVGLWLHNP